MDNTTLNAGTGGDVIATDDVAGVKYQRVKLVDGTADSTAAIGGDATNGLDVDVTRVQGTVTVDTELPAAVALADGTANPTVPGVGAFLMGWDTVNWDRLQQDGFGSLHVKVPSGLDVNNSVALAALPALAVSADNTGNPSLSKIGAYGMLFDGTTWDRAPGTSADGALVNLGANNDVTVTGTVALGAGSATVGNVGLAPRTSGGLTTYHLVSAATTNATVVKASAGQLYGYYIYNNNAAMRKVAFHNTASAPTAGASIFFTLNIPPNSAANVDFAMGIAFSAGIAFTTVTDNTDAGATAVAAGDLTINLFYA